MKPTHLFALASLLTGHCLALTPVSEGFKGSTLKATRWYEYPDIGNGNLKPINGKLNFVIPNSNGGQAYSNIELASSYPGYNEDWQMTIDLFNKVPKNSSCACGFTISNNSDRSDYLYINFFGKDGIAGGALENNVQGPHGFFAKGYNFTKGAVRIVFDHGKHRFTFFVSIKTKNEGYQFVKVGTFSPMGRTTSDVYADWDMNGESTFVIQLTGFSAGNAIEPGKVALDNFKLEAPPAPVPNPLKLPGL